MLKKILLILLAILAANISSAKTWEVPSGSTNNQITTLVSVSLSMPATGQQCGIEKQRLEEQKALDLAVSIVKTPNVSKEQLTTALRLISDNGGDSRIVDNLIEIIDTSGYAVNDAAMSCIRKMGLKKAVPILFDKMIFLITNPNYELFKKEIKPFDLGSGEGYKPKNYGEYYINEYNRMLILIGGDELHKLAIPMLDNENEKIKYHGATILGALGDTIAVPYLCEILDKNKTTGGDLRLALLLVKLDKDKAIPYLKEALKDNYHTIHGQYPLRYDAYRALQKVGVKVVCKGNDKYEVEE